MPAIATLLAAIVCFALSAVSAVLVCHGVLDWMLAYVLTGVALTLLRYAVIGICARGSSELRGTAAQYNALVFVCSVPFWPVDLAIMLAKAPRVLSMLSTAIRMSKWGKL